MSGGSGNGRLGRNPFEKKPTAQPIGGGKKKARAKTPQAEILTAARKAAKSRPAASERRLCSLGRLASLVESESFLFRLKLFALAREAILGALRRQGA